MTINKYQGNTKEEAIEKAKEELGASAVIMNVKEIKPKGPFKVFKNSVFEVTAAMEERERLYNPQDAINAPMKLHDKKGINLAADESIPISQLQERRSASYQRAEQAEKGRLQQAALNSAMQKSQEAPVAAVSEPLQGAMPQTAARESVMNSNNEGLERRLENLSNILEKQFSSEETRKIPEPVERVTPPAASNTESFQFIKMLYRTLLENEVNEVYVNQIMDEAEKVLHNGSSVDYILSNVYQKMILKLGKARGIQLSGKKPKIIFFIGPTGVGKTTTIAKIASKYKVDYSKKVAFMTADTYRIAATEQLRVYANILDVPMSIIYSAEEMNQAIERVNDYDLVFVDTAGFSHRNEGQREDMKRLMDGLDEQYEKEVYLVVSATIKYRDLLEIADIYKEIADYKLIFTKLDETTTYGNILNIKLYSGADLSYMTAGQNVPDDIEQFDTQKIVKQLLGGS